MKPRQKDFHVVLFIFKEAHNSFFDLGVYLLKSKFLEKKNCLLSLFLVTSRPQCNVIMGINMYAICNYKNIIQYLNTNGKSLQEESQKTKIFYYYEKEL